MDSQAGSVIKASLIADYGLFRIIYNFHLGPALLLRPPLSTKPGRKWITGVKST
jgi:hypothetical protein